MYALDFGRGGLKAIKDLPHLGASIDASEIARVDQLHPHAAQFRQRAPGACWPSTPRWPTTTPRTPSNIFPEIVVVIDNFAEFKESYRAPRSPS